MTLTRLQMLELEAANGNLGEEQRDELSAAGIDVEAAESLGGLVRDALRPAVAPSVVDAVMTALEIDDDLGRTLRQALRAPPAAGLADEVMQQVGAQALPDLREALLDGAGEPPELSDDAVAATGLPDAWPKVRAELRQALSPADTPSLADDIMGAIQLEEDGLDEGIGETLREAMLAEAGPAPSLWDGIADGIGEDPEWQQTRELLQEAVHDSPAPALADSVMAALAEDEADSVIEIAPHLPVENPQPANSTGFFARFAAPLTGIAVAAALLFVVTPSVTTNPGSGSHKGELVVETGTAGDDSFELADKNDVEIEDLYTETDAMVQVLDFGDDAPTIIWIDEGDDGATL